MSITLLPFQSHAAANEVKVYIYGAKQQYDQPPVIENNRILVPLRGIFESLWANVNWDPKTQTITAVKDKTKVILKIGSKYATVNGKAVAIDVPAKVIKNRTLVPLRFIGEALGEQVYWSKKEMIVKIGSEHNSRSSSFNKEAAIDVLAANGFYKHSETLATLNIFAPGSPGYTNVAVDLTIDSNMYIEILAWQDPVIPETKIIPGKVKFTLDTMIPSGSAHIYGIVSQVAVTGQHKELNKIFTYNGLKTKVTFIGGDRPAVKVIFSE